MPETMKTSKAGKSSAMNIVFIFFIAGAIVFAAYSGKMQEITDASFESAKSAVTLAIGLIGIMALWLGLVRVLEAGGLMYSLAKALRPLMVRLFPDVPATHPAMSSMILNISANMLGLGNAATPFGIKAMVELNKLNPFPGTATNAMCLFLAINTSSVALLPLGVIGVRAAAGATLPASIFFPTLIATTASTLVGVIVAMLLAKRDSAFLSEFQKASAQLSKEDSSLPQENETPEHSTKDQYEHLLSENSRLPYLVSILLMLSFTIAVVYQGINSENRLSFFTTELPTYWLMPMLMLMIVAYGLGRGVKVYEAVTEGAKQGFDIAIKIIPFLVAILVAIAMFRASGAMDMLSVILAPITKWIYLPPEVLPMALIRPLSGSGAFAIMSSLVNQAPDSYPSFLASTMMGCTETTFYVLAVYFGSVGVVKIRHALVAALLADLTGIVVSCFAAAAFWQG